MVALAIHAALAASPSCKAALLILCTLSGGTSAASIFVGRLSHLPIMTCLSRTSGLSATVPVFVTLFDQAPLCSSLRSAPQECMYDACQPFYKHRCVLPLPLSHIDNAFYAYPYDLQLVLKLPHPLAWLPHVIGPVGCTLHAGHSTCRRLMMA